MIKFIQSLKDRALLFFEKQKKNKKRSFKSEEKNFYKASSDWLYDKYHSQNVWLRWAIFANIAQGIMLVLALVALIALIPLKQHVPYLYAFNTASGEVTKIGELEKTNLTAEWQMARYFLRQYVMNRESFDMD